MKNIYKLLAIFAVAFLTVLSVNAQTRTVEVDGWPPPYSGSPDDFNNVLYDAIDNDSTARKTNPDVIYVLKRDHKYPQGNIIKNYDYHLQIVGEDGAGLLPELIVGKKTDGSYGNDFIQAYNDLTIKNLAVSGTRPDDAYLNRMIEARGKNSTYTLDNIIFDQDRGGALVVNADSMKVFATDVIVGNCGHRKTVGGNGRFMDLRPTALYVDSIVIVNCTYSFSSDRFLRNMGSIVNYLKIDHASMINSVGMYGGLQLGHARTAIVTNSLFANAISNGHSDLRAVEQTQPGNTFSVISLDTVFDSQVVEVRNNNIYFDQVIQDVWAKYDSVSMPLSITATIETALGAAASEAYFEEALTFTQACDPISAYVDAYYTNPNADTYPENWCVGGQGGFFPDEMDFSYSTDATSYSAADGGYPVGNLNYWPAEKAAWELEDNVGVEARVMESSKSLRNYPNPFNHSTIIAYELDGASNVTLDVYEITGRRVRSLVSEFQSAGAYEVTFDAAGLAGGMYFYKLDNGSEVQVNNMIISK